VKDSNLTVATANVKRLNRMALGGEESSEIYYSQSLEGISVT
jgi:hypothetical protein